ncbi:MAG TPA: CHAT domain-containing protein [Pyrinomonadaceae bacterium]|nr:CHAT domain-containing protein [Pyrinomonadaceae bacterium]
MLAVQRSSFRRRRLVSVLLCCGLIVLVVILTRSSETPSSAAETSVTDDGPIQLVPDSGVKLELVGGAKQAFTITVEQGKLLRFAIDKGDLVLSTALYGPTGVKLLEHVSQDFELVQFSFATQFTGTYRIELQSLEKTKTSKPYELKLQPVTNATAQDRKGSEAWQSFVRADRLCAEWTPGSFRQAITQYDRAATIWTSISDFGNASTANLKSADVYFRLSEYSEALKRYQSAVTLSQKTGDWFATARALSRSARLQSYLGHNELAEKQLSESLRLFNDHASNQDSLFTNGRGESLSNLAEVSYAKGDFLTSSKQFEEALKILANDRKGEAKVRLYQGYIAGGIGDLERALKEITRARELYTETNNKAGEGLALIALGLCHYSQDVEKSIVFHREAFELFHSIGDRYGEAAAHNAIGQGYEYLDDQALALSNYEQALRKFEDIGAVDGISMSMFKIAHMHDLGGRFEQALSYYDRSVRITQASGNLRNEGFALNEIASIYVKQGLVERAVAQYQRVLNFFEHIGDLRGQATALNSYGDLLFQRDEKQKALELYLRALPMSEKVADEDIRTTTLYNLARTHAKLGTVDDALSFINRSLKNIEDLRATVRSPEFRATYVSGVQKHYELCIDILMQLHKLHPGAGFDQQAFIVSEKNRSRVLLDLVNESRANIREGAAKELLDRERSLGGLIRLQAQYRMDLLLSGKNSAEISEVENKLTQLKADYQEVEAQLRQRNPRLLSLEGSVTLEQIQKELRDSDTMLLEYSLGDERSYLWMVTSNSFQTFELPARKTIEEPARESYKLITARQNGIDNEYLSKLAATDERELEIRSKLGNMLLGPIAGNLGSRRLLVVSEGALQYVPFDALLLPGHSSAPLLETNEVVVLPSISTLIAIRSARHSLTSTSKLLAVIADPVFNANDERIQGVANEPAVAKAATDKSVDHNLPQTPGILIRDGALVRLVHASEEAAAISKIAPWGTTMVATGFDANRETAMSPDVGQYQIVHFATHGFLNSEHPELSGLVFTTTDRHGVKTNGLMPLHDIYSLELSAELTVLSACQTALGKQIKGEGLVGLAHGFMAAGSKSVVASLWKVDDRATAVLMADFYAAMLDQGMAPAAALRFAKLKMMRDKQWSAPYYWAGFELQGEYANTIVVNHYSWLTSRLVLLLLVILIVVALIVFRKRIRRLPHHR